MDMVWNPPPHSSNPLSPFEKGRCTFGLSKVEGGFENLEIEGAPFQFRPPNFSRKCTLLDLKNTIFHLRWAFNQLLVIIVVNNISNVKNNISVDDET